MRKILFTLFIFILSVNVYSQTDTEFWFACPDLSSVHFETCVKLRFITFDKATTVTVLQPANPNFTPQVIPIAANSFGTLELGVSSLFPYIETKAGGIDNTGIYIKSENEITAYYANTCDNSEIYSLKGKNALGTDFIIPTQFEYNNDAGYQGGSSVEVVAAKDSTHVTIIPTQACVGHAKGVPFTITLNKGQSFALRATGLLAADHLFNTQIKSDKPIAVNYTDDSVAGPGVDLIGDQLVPVSLAGNNYIVVKNNGNVEKVYIFPTQDTTNVYVKGTKLISMNLGGKSVYTLTDTATHINSDKPVIVLQVTSKGTELGAALVPSLDCTGSLEIAYKPASTGDPLVSIVTKTENVGNFTVNGYTFFLPPSVFKKVQGDTTWSYCIRTLSTTDVLRIKNSSGFFHIGIFDSPGTTCSFGYFSNFNIVPLQATTNKSFYVEGEKIKLSFANESSFTNIRWKGPSGFNSNIVNPEIENVTEDNSGMYVLSASHVDGCNVEPDTIFVSVLKKTTTKELGICLNNSIKLTADGYAPYTWTPAGLPQVQTITVKPNTSTTYTVINSKTGYNLVSNSDFQAGNIYFSSGLNYDPTTVSSLGMYTVGSSPILFNPVFADINDHTYGNSSGKQLIVNCKAGKANIWTQTIRNIKSGTPYVLSAWFVAANLGGTPAKLQFSINDVLVGSVITPPNDGNWQKFDYTWNSDATNATIRISTDASTSSGSSVCVDDIHFEPLFQVVDTFYVAVRDSLKPIIKGDAYICNGGARLSVDSGYESYLWSNGTTTTAITVTEPGNYFVRVTDGSCAGSGYVTVAPNSLKVTVSLDTLYKICSGELNLGIDYTLVSGELGFYDILFDAKAKQAGLADAENQQPTGSRFEINLPAGVRPDIYKAELKVYEKTCGAISQSPLEIMVKYPSELLAQRWNDVIGVTNSTFNGGYIFTAYQWYKNGVPMLGQTKSYLYESGSLKEEDRYSVLLTRKDDGATLFTCDFLPKLLTNNDIVTTLAAPSQRIQLEKISESGIATFLSITGVIMSRQQINANNANVQVPAQRGMYILQIATGKDYKQYQIIVR